MRSSGKKSLLLVGRGRWGQNYIKTILNINDVTLDTAGRDDWKAKIDAIPDGVIVATPPDSHIEIASYALDRGIPVLIEKPLALSAAEASKLSHYDQSKILVNHIHLFAPAYEKLVELAKQEGISYIVSLGADNGPIRSYSSLLDYGPHDLAMGSYLCSLPPKLKTFDCDHENGQTNWHLDVTYQNIDHYILVGNANQKKKRLFYVRTNDSNIVSYNDLDRHKLLFNTKIIKISPISPLESVLFAFINIINDIPDPRSGIGMSIDILKLIDKVLILRHL